MLNPPGRAKCIDSKGGCDVDINSTTVPDGSSINYNVIGTDYTNWAVLYSCRTLMDGLVAWDYVWVLSREPQLT